jgi:hypothetical protein
MEGARSVRGKKTLGQPLTVEAIGSIFQDFRPAPPIGMLFCMEQQATE